MTREALVFDTGEISHSLVSAHLQRQMERVGVETEAVDRLSTDCGAILLSFRSPQPGFVNSLVALRNAGLEVDRNKRAQSDPLVIAGGTAMINPFPISKFVDAIYVGDADLYTFEAIGQVCNTGESKEKRLGRLAKAGFYVPVMADQSTKPIFHHAESPDFAWVVGKNVVQHYNSPGDMASTTAYIEIKKGCGMGCVFCIDADNHSRVMPIAEYEQLVRSILSSHPGLDSLRMSFPSLTKNELLSFLDVTEMLRADTDSHFLINLGSTMPNHFDLEVASRLVKLGQKVMTFAPEIAEGERDGTDLRKSYKRWLTDRALFSAIENGLQAGMSELVLYHLTGFPGETDSHIDAFVEMMKKIEREYSKLDKITVISGPVFPTVGTDLERAPQIPFGEADRRWKFFKYHFDVGSKVNPVWILNMPGKVRYNTTGAGADVYFCQAYYHRTDKLMGKAINALSRDVRNLDDVFRLGVAAHELVLSGAGIDVGAMFGAKDIVTSERIDRQGI